MNVGNLHISAEDRGAVLKAGLHEKQNPQPDWEDRPINLLTPDAVNDPISGFPLLKGVPVMLEKI